MDTPLAVAGTPVAVEGTPLGVEEGTLVAVLEQDNQQVEGRMGFEEEEGRPPAQKMTMTLPYSKHVAQIF